MARGVLAILGSGETAPGMTKVHRGLLQRLDSVRAVNLDSSYGFQLNVPQMSEKLEEYFKVSLLIDLTTLHFANFEKSSELDRALFKQRVREANFVFAGPGSPSYALNQWTPLNLGEDLQGVLDDDGTLCIASAAALTLGSFTAPIYEIYKVGVEPYWLQGLNILGHFGLNCVVIPHFDNNEGGNYDTRYCYLGEPRLRFLEERLPDGVATLGIDEHTAVIFDFARDTLNVQGRSQGYWIAGNEVTVLANGSTLPLESLRNAVSRTSRTETRSPNSSPVDDAERLAQMALEGGKDALDAVARLVRLAQLGGDGHVPAAPLVDNILAVRLKARESGLYEVADLIRDALVSSGIEVADSPTGSTWSLR